METEEERPVEECRGSRRGSRHDSRDSRDKWQDVFRVNPESQKRWDVIKVVLRSLSLVCAVALALCCVAKVYNSRMADPTRMTNAVVIAIILVSLPCLYPLDGIAAMCSPAPPAKLDKADKSACDQTIGDGLWSLTEFVTICVRTGRSGLRLTGIPPWGHVAVELLIWLFYLVSMAAVISDLMSSDGLVGSRISFNIAILALEILLMFVPRETFPPSAVPNVRLDVHIAHSRALTMTFRGLHFTLFVRACMETERRNSDRRIRKVISSLRERGLNISSRTDNKKQGSHESTAVASEPSCPERRGRDMESSATLPATPDRMVAQQPGVKAWELSTTPDQTLAQQPEAEAWELPATPDGRMTHQTEVETRVEENLKFVIPSSIIKEMTGEKFTMMGPADGEQKYTGVRRGR